jgi:hypothetical protein
VRAINLVATLVSISILTPAAAFAQVNYGDFLGTGVDFLQVTETTQTPPDPAVLWDTPFLNGVGNGLLFFPPDFTSTCAAGSSDITSSQLTTTIMAQGANTLDLVMLLESGDVTLTKFPPFGDPTTNASASIGGFLTVIEDTGGPIVPVVIPFAGTFVPTSTFSLPGDFGASVWQASFTVDVAAQVPNATKAILQLDNTLDSNCGAGATNGKIQKKSVGGPTVALIINPVECTLDIDKTCCVPQPPLPGGDICDGKGVRAVFEVVGGDCTDTTNQQEGEAKCSGPNPIVDPMTDTVSVAFRKAQDANEMTVTPDTGLAVGDTFEIASISDPNLKNQLKLLVTGPGGTQNQEVHVSCSRALRCGDQFGSLMLVEFESDLAGTVVCTDPEAPQTATRCVAPSAPQGTSCDSKLTEAVFRFTPSACQNPLPNPQGGSAECIGDASDTNLPVSVIYTGNKPDRIVVSPAAGIDDGDTIRLSATGKPDLEPNVKLLIQDASGVQQVLEFHVSCSQPLACGDVFGSLTLTGFTTKNGLEVECDPIPPPSPIFADACEVPLAPPSPHCTSKVNELTLVYIGDFLGEGCTVSNPQDGSASCTGVADPGDPVSVTITNDPIKVSADPATGIPFGGLVTISREDGGLPTELGSTLEFDVTGAGGTQSLVIHTSCSKPLNLGDRFGSFGVFAIDRKDDGLLSLGGEVEYQYKVTADAGNPATADNVSVDDNVFGNIVSGETLDPGEMKTFFVTKTLFGSETNTATVSGDIGGDLCLGAVDSVDVTVTAPPQGSFDCTAAQPIDEITMTWNGLVDVHVVAWDGDVGSTRLVHTFMEDWADPVVPGEDFTVSGMGGSPNDQVWQIFDATDPAQPVLIGHSKFHISCSDDDMSGIEDCGKAQGDGKSDDPGFINGWLLEGMSGDQKLACTPGESIVPSTCGLGFELFFVMPGLFWLHRRRLRKTA